MKKLILLIVIFTSCLSVDIEEPYCLKLTIEEKDERKLSLEEKDRYIKELKDALKITLDCAEQRQLWGRSKK